MKQTIIQGLILTAVMCVFLAGLASGCSPESAEGLGVGDRVPYDPDLYGWKTASWSPFAAEDSIKGFAYGGGRYVAVARSGTGGVIAWSDDGDIWHKAKKAVPVTNPATDPGTVPDPFAAKFNAVAFGGGRFIAVGDAGELAWSDDGVYWTAGRIGNGIFGTENIYGIAYGYAPPSGGESDYVFVAVGGNSNIAWTYNGTSWASSRPTNFGDSPAAAINDIVYDAEDKRFYIVGRAGNGDAGSNTGWSENPKSTDWHHYKYTGENDSGYPFFGNSINKIALGMYGGEKAVIVAFTEWGGRRIAISKAANFRDNNGHDWDADLDAGQFGNNGINGVAFGGGNFVAAGSSAMIGWWPSAKPGSVPQRYWRALSFREFAWWEITALAAMNGRFYVGGIGGKIGYSK